MLAEEVGERNGIAHLHLIEIAKRSAKGGAVPGQGDVALLARQRRISKVPDTGSQVIDRHARHDGGLLHPDTRDGELRECSVGLGDIERFDRRNRGGCWRNCGRGCRARNRGERGWRHRGWRGRRCRPWEWRPDLALEHSSELLLRCCSLDAGTPELVANESEKQHA